MIILQLRKKWCPAKNNSLSSGLHAIANLSELVLNPETFLSCSWNWSETELGKHLTESFVNNLMKPFPKKILKVCNF